jgi:hypothetical protein
MTEEVSPNVSSCLSRYAQPQVSEGIVCSLYQVSFWITFTCQAQPITGRRAPLRYQATSAFGPVLKS